MSRYLTSSKIALLALITLYTEAVVPSTATISILSFLVSHVLPIKASTVPHDSLSSHRDYVVTIDSIQQATLPHASGIPGRTLWDLLLKKLWEVNSFDSLHVFFDSLSLLFQKTPEELQRATEEERLAASKRFLISRTSPLGVFVRRAQVEFTRLQFDTGITLWKSFVAYRAPTLAMWKRRNPTVGKTSFDSNLVDDRLGVEDRLTTLAYGDVINEPWKEATVSTDDLEKLLENQIDQMQRMGNRLSQDMKSKLQRMIETGVTVPSLLHYVKFLDSWKAGDYPSSFDNLHRFFDYTVHSQDRMFYQYALLNLAILQADFGSFPEAITAIQETIATARENNDMTCLNYSLSWLYHFGKAHPEMIKEIRATGVLGPDKEALTFLKAKAKETGMWSLLSTSLLSEAKLTLSSGDSVSHALECILQSAHLNLTKNVTSAIGSQMGMQASTFGRLGVSCQSWLYGELFQQCYADQSPAEDILHSGCRNAFLLAQKGRYEEALARMKGINPDTLRTLKYHQYWMACLGLFKLRRSLHKNNLVAAEHFLSKIQAVPCLGQDLDFLIVTCKIDLHMRRRNYNEALGIVETLGSKLEAEDADIYQRIKLMTLKARLYDKAGIPQKGFSVAFRAASLAHQTMLLPSLWEAVGALSRILISVEEFDAAAQLLESIMPQVLECEDCELAAQSYSFLADAQMGMAGQAPPDSLSRKERLNRAVESIDASFDEYSRIEDLKGQCEMMAKKATVMYLNGDPVLANDYAAKYLDIKRVAREEEMVV